MTTIRGFLVLCRLAVLTATGLCASQTIASADPADPSSPNFVVGGDFARDVGDSRFSLLGVPLMSAATPLDEGRSSSVALGLSVGGGLRLELLGGAGSVAGPEAGLARGADALPEYTLQTNAIYAFDLPDSPFAAHVGAGIGLQSAGTGADRLLGFSSADPRSNSMVYEFLVGGEYALLPSLKLGAEYRFFNATQLDGSLVRTLDPARVPASGHSVLLRLRYDFGAGGGSGPAASVMLAPSLPAPPAPPSVQPAMPARGPEPQRSFQVFFDFDKADVTSASADVIRSAAASIKSGQLTRITITGHTDTVGTAAYNQGLSEHRAEAVKQLLVGEGVSADEISTVGVGFGDPLVPTADGVAEPQNRRAEIVLN